MYLCEHPLWILDSPFAITKENSLFFTEKNNLNMMTTSFKPTGSQQQSPHGTEMQEMI